VEGRLANVCGAVLLGGRSARMGRDKAHLRLEGVSLAARTARLLGRVCEDVMLVGGEPPPDAPGRPVPDPGGPPSALRGLVGALAAARAERVLVVATDLPRLSETLLWALVALPEADVALPRDAGGLQPLCALYRREAVHAPAAERLARGELALHALLDGLSKSLLEGADLDALDPGGSAFANANTPDAWRRLVGDG